MKRFFKKIFSSMALNIIGAVVGLLATLGVVVSIIGYYSFLDAFKKEYASVTYRMADSVTIDVNGDHLQSYLDGQEMDEYNATVDALNKSCVKLNVSLIYVIVVDRSDYGNFVSIFNVVNNEVDGDKYTPWPLGYQRKTTNDEYRTKYRALYEETSLYETLFRIRTTDGQHPHITTLVPVKNSSNEVVAILCMQRPVSELRQSVAPYLRAVVASVVTIVVVAIVLIVLFVRLSIMKPIVAVSKETTRFAKENVKGKPLGKISRYEVLTNLAKSIDSMETDMVQYMENLTSITAEKERIGAELSIATQIQKDSLPDIFPAFPNRHDFDIYASMDPAKEVGGDFYNFLFIDDDHLALVIADVSGKGIPAALMMMVSNILISNRARMGGKPSDILSYVNNDLCDHNNSTMFVTVWLGILELSTGKLISSNAGHEDPIVYRDGGSYKEVKEKHSLVLGAMKDIPFFDQEITLNKGDKLFLFTDGLAEAKDSNGKLYTIERVLKSLNAHRDESPKELLSSVKHDVDEYVKDAPQFDDLTMMCVEIKK